MELGKKLFINRKFNIDVYVWDTIKTKLNCEIVVKISNLAIMRFNSVSTYIRDYEIRK